MPYSLWVNDLTDEFTKLRTTYHPEVEISVNIDTDDGDENIGSHQPSHLAQSDNLPHKHSNVNIRAIKDKLTKNLMQSTNVDRSINNSKEPPLSTIPPWVELTHEFRVVLQRLKESIQLLSNLYAARLANHFDLASEQGQDAEIASCSSIIKDDLRHCERLIKLIPSNPGAQRSQQDLKIMENAMKAMGMMLSQQSKLFRQVEQAFLAKLKERRQAEINEDPLSYRSDPKLAASVFDTLSNPSESGELDVSHAAALQELEQNNDARDAAIIQVAQDINEIAGLFKELNVLIIEQGSILDRIDYNVDQAIERIDKGVVELIEADKISKKGISTKAIGILLIVCVLLLLIFIIKKSSGG